MVLHHMVTNILLFSKYAVRFCPKSLAPAEKVTVSLTPVKIRVIRVQKPNKIL
jgi:hypothetical protein